MIRIGLLLIAGVVGASGQLVQTFTNVSAASGNATLAPDAVVTAMGIAFPVAQPATAQSVPLPTSLGGISVQVVDSAGTARLAGLYYASATQINYVMPAGTVTGTVTVNVLNGSAVAETAQAQVAAVAPALFSADLTGKGPAAATAVAVAIPSTMQSPVQVFICVDPQKGCRALPLNTGVDRPVYLSFYGEGIRGAQKVTAAIGGIEVPVLYAGPQPTNPGLDQVNVPLILSLHGVGLVDVVVTADGVASNPVQILVQ
jgi:uncharacterized protein (TIGR03437 family)